MTCHPELQRRISPDVHRSFALLRMTAIVHLLALGVCVASMNAQAQTSTYAVIDDGIPTPLTQQPGDATRGRAIVTNRQVGMCQLCHQVPGSSDRFQGDIATNLAGAGARWTAPQLRLRLVDSRRVNADSVMPAYFKVDALHRVGATWRDQTILNAQQIEDVVAWLVSLK